MSGTSETGQGQGMSRATARGVELTIIVLCLAALIFVFQPFSHWLAGLGMILVVVGGLSFNLVPLCVPGKPARALVKAAAIVLTILLIAAGIAISAAAFYGDYLRASACEKEKPGSRNWNVKLGCEKARWLICDRLDADTKAPIVEWCTADPG